MVRVFLVGEMGLICNLMAAVLEDEPDIEVVGRTTSVDDAIARAAESDVILVNTRLPDNGALVLTKAVVEADPSVKVIVVELSESEAEILQHVEAGADGYVLKDHSIDDLLTRVRAAHRDRAIVSPSIAARLMSRVTELARLFRSVESGVNDATDLTPRELEILALIAQDLTNQEIADRLFIEVGTVKNHVHNILQKLGVSSRQEAAVYLALVRGPGY